MAKQSKLVLGKARRTVTYDFSKSKVMTVPNQSLTLKDILKRFIRKEALPIEHQGFYETRFGDLGKVKDMDLTEQVDVIDNIKRYVSRASELLKERDKPTPVPPVVPPPPKE